MSPDPLTTIGAAKELHDLYNVAKAEGWLERLADIFRTKQKVLVLGSTGVGKSSFLKSLTNELTASIDRANRTQFKELIALKLGDIPFRFLDTPGQDEHIERRRQVYRDAIKDGIDGVINVVSYGYHEYNREVIEPGLAPAIGANDTVDQRFLTEHRTQEEAVLSEWTSLILPTARWLITAVNKADLWWTDRSKVHRHYASPGSYFNALGPSGHVLSPIVLSYSVRFQKFYGQSPIDGTFDESDRSRLRREFIHHLIASAAK